MPTKKKRVGFIPREDVLKLICKLSTENNLSNSKIISILVEEALSIRGIFDKKNARLNQSYKDINYSLHYSNGRHFDINDNKKAAYNTKSGNYKVSNESTLFDQSSQLSFDLQTYKKFISFLKFQKMMKEYDS